MKVVGNNDVVPVLRDTQKIGFVPTVRGNRMAIGLLHVYV